MSSLFWSELIDARERMEALSPDGQTARVTVYLRGGQSFQPRLVARHRDSSWLTFQTIESGEDSRVIAVREEQVERVEVTIVPRVEAPIGFGVVLADDSLPLSDDQ